MSSFRNHRVIVASLFLPTTVAFGESSLSTPDHSVSESGSQSPQCSAVERPAFNQRLSGSVPLKSIVEDLKVCSPALVHEHSTRPHCRPEPSTLSHLPNQIFILHLPSSSTLQALSRVLHPAHSLPNHPQIQRRRLFCRHPRLITHSLSSVLASSRLHIRMSSTVPASNANNPAPLLAVPRL